MSRSNRVPFLLILNLLACKVAKNDTFSQPKSNPSGMESSAESTPVAIPDTYSDSAAIQDGKAEIALINKIFGSIDSQAHEKLGMLGSGFGGNMSGVGPKCNQVFEFYKDAFIANLQSQKIQLKYYQPTSVLYSGRWYSGYVTQHIYFGVGTIPKGLYEAPKLLYIMDPWRYGSSKRIDLADNPNAIDSVTGFYKGSTPSN